MDTSTMMNALTTQHYECYANIQMNTSTIANVATTQRYKRCTFDSPGLPNDSAGNPGLSMVCVEQRRRCCAFFD